MLTKEQIINLARKQEWWNEFDEKRRISIEKAAYYAIMSRDYETFITGSFLIDSLVWYDRANKFVKDFADTLQSENSALVEEIQSTGTLPGTAGEQIRKALESYKEQVSASWQA